MTRYELLKNKILTPKAYEQSIGFMRIIGGDNILDTTSVHPESYDIALKLLNDTKISLDKLGTKEAIDKISNLDLNKYSSENNIDIFTLKDIVECIKKPNRDFREDFPKPLLKSNILDIKDLKKGMKLEGTVRNIVDFGAFIDIGLHDSRTCTYI